MGLVSGLASTCVRRCKLGRVGVTHQKQKYIDIFLICPYCKEPTMSPAVLSLAFSLSVLAQTGPLSGGVASPERQRELLEEVHRRLASPEHQARLRQEAARGEESRRRVAAEQSARNVARDNFHEGKTDSPSSDAVESNDAQTFFNMVLICAFLIYFLPSFIAGFRGHHDFPAIVALNLLLGWTFLGWVAALCWALTHVKSDQYHVYVHDTKSRQGKGKPVNFFDGQDPLPKVEPPRPPSIDLGIKLDDKLIF